MISIGLASQFAPSASSLTALLVLSSLSHQWTGISVSEMSSTNLAVTIDAEQSIVDSVLLEVASALGAYFVVSGVDKVITITEAA